MRFRPEQHLRHPIAIRAVREQGQRVDCRAFTVWWKPRASAPAASPAAKPELPRMCVIASSKAVGHAVLRNRTKRRLREVFRQQQDRVPPGCDLLLVARNSATSWPILDLEKRFADACAQIAAVRSGARPS